MKITDKEPRIVSHRFTMFLAMNPAETFISGDRWKLTEAKARAAAIRAEARRKKR